MSFSPLHCFAIGVGSAVWSTTAIPAPSRMAGYCSGVMSGSRCTRTSGSLDLRKRSKITASDSLASTNTPRTAFPLVVLIQRSGRDAGERQHGMHQHVGAGRAIRLRGVFQLIMADAVL